MSGYFVHGGTQYAYGQSHQQAPSQSTGLSAYPQTQTPQATQFYQNTSAYGTGQQSRPILSATHKNTINTGYTSFGSSLGQSYSNQHSSQTQSYSTPDTDRAYGGRPAASTDAYGGSSYSSGSTNFGSYEMKDDKYSSSGSMGLRNIGSSSTYFQSQTPLTTSYPQTAYSKQEEASSSQYSYEKALYVAANQYFLNKKVEASRGARGGGASQSMRGGRGRGSAKSGSSYHSNTSGPKVIKATEVKAYLYAWCGQRRLKPEYTIEPMGNPPKTKFCCTLKIAGLDYTAKVTAASKKDSQSKAAWDFCEHLVKTGYMKESELPEKPTDPMPKSASAPKPSTPAGTDPSVAESVEESGGWSIENCRQRLNQFTQRWRIPAEFKHETHGPEHARTFVAELTIRIKWLEKDFHARERGNNKKQATAVCALAMIRQLYKEDLVEKHGDPIKHPLKKQPSKDTEKKTEQLNSGSLKRKADENGAEDVDQYGNWKLEDGRQRLHMYCQATNQPFEMKYTPDGNVPPRTFTASISIDASVDGETQKLEKSHTCVGKKQAAQHCALEMIKELFGLSLVEANLGPQQSKKKNQRNQRPHQSDISPFGSLMEMPGPYMSPMYSAGPVFPPYPMAPPMLRRTPYDDNMISEKHRRIYPTEFELNVIQKTVRSVETSLRQVSDALSKESPSKESEKTEEQSEDDNNQEVKRLLQGVVRVGPLAKGLLLTGDLTARLVLLCVDLPSSSLLIKVSSCLSKVLEETGESYTVEPSIEECMIKVQSPSEKNDVDEQVSCSVTVSLTSPLMRTIEPASGPADMLNRNKCLQSLAELRHAKWFQACASGLPSCVVLIRILIDMKKRMSTWLPLSEWALELLVEKALHTSVFTHLTPGEGLRRILSCISSGILLEDGPGIYDPCEKVATDVIGDMKLQEREDITESAHHALRMLAYHQIHKILGIEPLQQKVRKSTGEEENAMTDI